MQHGYRNATVVLGVLTAVIGLILIATSIARGGGPLAVGVIVGIAFTVLGAGRAYVAGRRT